MQLSIRRLGSNFAEVKLTLAEQLRLSLSEVVQLVVPSVCVCHGGLNSNSA